MIRLHKKFVLLSLFFVSANAIAEQQPLWELGAGAGVLSAPDYRGSDERETYLLPIPYIVYRGERLSIDRSRISGLIFSSERIQLDFSINGSLPVNSDDNRARQGMPDLDPSIEIGPSLNILLSQPRSKHFELSFNIPVRGVIASDLSDAQAIGGLINPRIEASWANVFGGWRAGLVFGPLFATKKYHDYFYSVDPIYATANRPAYAAKGGYSGLQLTTSLTRRFGNIWVGGFVRADDLHGTAFEDSPLLKSKHSVMAGVGASWIFAKSKMLVERKE